MRRVACFMMIALSGVAAFGQGLLDCVEPDVLRALLSPRLGEPPPVITAAVPPELSGLKMPGGFTWIGSAERVTGRLDATTNATLTTAAWRSNLAPEAARAAAAAALVAAGWEVRAPFGPGIQVFSSPAMAMSGQTACRDGKPVNVNASAMDGVTYALIIIQRGNNNRSACNESVPPFFTSATGLQRYLPRLELPANPVTGLPARWRSGGLGSSAGSVHANADFSVDDTAGNVAQHFARQMAEQGWTRDAAWSGAVTAGSSWSKRPDAGTRIQGTLQVTAFDERQFMATLRVIQLP